MESKTLDKFPVLLSDLSNPIYKNHRVTYLIKNPAGKSNTQQTANNNMATAFTSAALPPTASMASMPKKTNRHVNKVECAEDNHLGASNKQATPLVKKSEPSLQKV